MAAKPNFLPTEIHLLPAKEPDFLNILAQLDQLFSLAFKNAVHDAFDLCHYWHRLRFFAGSTGSAFAFGPRSPKACLAVAAGAAPGCFFARFLIGIFLRR
jgi:hypothetical protein